MYRSVIKPVIDWIGALILLTITSPLLIVVALVIYMIDGSPVLFLQARSGKNMKRFYLIKLRTLLPSEGANLSMNHRKTTVTGRFLRRSAIDEMPQLLNILMGHMSFIGPRPLPVEYDSKYKDSEKTRFLVQPGITGWAQINGRNNISWDERFRLDGWYVANYNCLVDLKILWVTIGQLIKHQDDKSMPVFEGTN